MKSNFDIKRLVRSNVLSLKPYSSARDEFKEGQANTVFLDANENPVGDGLNRYPDPQQRELKWAIASKLKISEKNIFLGNGSDEVLDLLFRTFCEPHKDQVLILPPTYGMYKVLARINAVTLQEVLLDTNFQPEVDNILALNTKGAKLLFLCSPNNPTGNLMDPELLERLLRGFNGLVVIDEAYIQYSEQQSWIHRLKEFPNLVVLQTFSKAYGLAGIRLGIGFASEGILQILNKIKPPYNINQLTIQRALEQLSETEIEHIRAQNEDQKQLLKRAFDDIPIIKKVYPSDANFILIQVDDAKKRYQELLELGIVVRDRSNEPLCDNCLRVTIGTTKENLRLLAALKKLKS